nr:immunoglobulin light chain junction region [Macaca mulatta]MOX48189.1 immunoglobulin light chain junction region [Macaca mulatta]MOX48736.1 immunoglobulin light chain junction region [Macaca mulatta]MOX49414.1 immunoglobulin light chain junction region [Macaca mulatta]MOX49441.1 immunoglobulin light chain junction region [Macaca mulatta]
CQQYNNLALTF